MQPQVDDFDQRVYLHRSWEEFEQFLAIRGDAAGTRITCLDGIAFFSSFVSDREQARAVRNFLAALRRN